MEIERDHFCWDGNYHGVEDWYEKEEVVIEMRDDVFSGVGWVRGGRRRRHRLRFWEARRGAAVIVAVGTPFATVRVRGCRVDERCARTDLHGECSGRDALGATGCEGGFGCGGKSLSVRGNRNAVGVSISDELGRDSGGCRYVSVRHDDGGETLGRSGVRNLESRDSCGWSPVGVGFYYGGYLGHGCRYRMVFVVVDGDAGCMLPDACSGPRFNVLANNGPLHRWVAGGISPLRVS